MTVQLIPVTTDNQAQLTALFELYCQEMVQYLDQREVQEHPVDPAAILNHYWTSTPKWPYLLEADGSVVGFCLLRRYPDEPDTFDIDQFYVARAGRRQGTGIQALQQVLARHPGNWLIRVLQTNTGALTFWRHAVESCIGSDYHCDSSNPKSHFIRFNTGSQETTQ